MHTNPTIQQSIKGFQNVLSMFYEDKLTPQVLHNNITKKDRETFDRKIHKQPNKYLSGRQLSQNQINVVKSIYLMQCKGINSDCFHSVYAYCHNCKIAEKREKFLNFSFNTDDHKDCAVCISTIEKNEIIGVLICKHHFHKECISRWLSCKLSCPCCRNSFHKYME